MDDQPEECPQTIRKNHWGGRAPYIHVNKHDGKVQLRLNEQATACYEMDAAMAWKCARALMDAAQAARQGKLDRLAKDAERAQREAQQEEERMAAAFREAGEGSIA